MMLSTNRIPVLLTLVCFAAVGCGSTDATITEPEDEEVEETDDTDETDEPPPDTLPPPSMVELNSHAGDWVGQGEHHKYTKENAILEVTANGAFVQFRVTGDENWRGRFQLPTGYDRIEAGTFEGVSRYSGHDPEVGGMNWSGEGRTCSSLTGTFTVDSARYEGDDLSVIALRFVQQCSR